MGTSVIAFSGKAGSGKTTSTDYLLKTYPDKYVKINFKDAMVEEMRRIFPQTLRMMSLSSENYEFGIRTVDDLFTHKPPEMRALMQEFGTELRRGDDPDYWVKAWMRKANKVISEGKVIVVDDLRFLNEEKAIRGLGGMVIKVSRNDITDTGTHISEVEMDKIVGDFNISANRGEYELLYKEIEEHLAKIKD